MTTTAHVRAELPLLSRADIKLGRDTVCAKVPRAGDGKPKMASPLCYCAFLIMFSRRL